MARILVNKSSNTYSIVGMKEEVFFTLLKTINKVAMKVADPEFKEVTDATAEKIVNVNNELRNAFARSVEIWTFFIIQTKRIEQIGKEIAENPI